MTITELYGIVKEYKEDFDDFKNNEFYHLSKRVDKLLYALIAVFGGIIATLVAVIIK